MFPAADHSSRLRVHVPLAMRPTTSHRRAGRLRTAGLRARSGTSSRPPGSPTTTTRLASRSTRGAGCALAAACTVGRTPSAGRRGQRWFTSDEDSYANSCGVGVGGGEAETLVTSTTTESSSGASGNCGGSGEADGVVVAGSFAVVKRSDDPRADFRRSMAEMVVGRAIYDADGLERLLRCFLALNHQRHRRDIVAAFGDVWEAVFSNPTSSQRRIVTSDSAICKAAATVSNRR